MGSGGDHGGGYVEGDKAESLVDENRSPADDGSKQMSEATGTEEIATTLSNARAQLTRDLHASHPERTTDELRDGVQRILERLVVMRIAEDRGIIPHETPVRLRESWVGTETCTPIKDLEIAFRGIGPLHQTDLFDDRLFDGRSFEGYDVSTDVLSEIVDDLSAYHFAHVDTDVLGLLYEEYLGNTIGNGRDGGTVEIRMRADERREGGVYYTPVPVVEYIVEATLGTRVDAIVDDARAKLEGTDPDFDAARTTFDQIEEITFLDVTCGSGAFLIAAYDLMFDRYEEFKSLVHDAAGRNKRSSAVEDALPDDIGQRILQNNLYGVDVDRQATEIATVNLLLRAIPSEDARQSIPKNNVRRGNSLLNGSPAEVADVLGITVENARDLGAFEWKTEFEEVFEENGGFDVIAGNPPWGADISSIKSWVEHDEHGFELAEGQYDSYELLIELSGDILAVGGTLGFIIPDSIFREEHEELREWLAMRHTIDQAHKLGEGIFDDVWSGTAIVQYTAEKSDGTNAVECSVLRKADRERMSGTGRAALSTLIDERRNLKTQQRIRDEPDFGIRPFADEEDYEIMEQMESNTIDLSGLIEDSRGDEIGKSGEVMRCPNCLEWDTYPRKRAASSGGGYYPKTCTHCDHDYEFEDAVEAREIITEHQPEGSWKKLYFGEHVTRYRPTGHAYVDDSVSGIDFEDESLYEPPKMLLRKTGFGFNAFIEYEDARCLQVVFVFRLKALAEREEPFDEYPWTEYDLEYVLGLLNSRLMLYYYTKQRSEIEWQSYPYKTQGLVMGLPFPKIDFDDDGERQRYERFVHLVREACQSLGQIDEQVDWEIERLAYEFYGIPEEKRSRITNELTELQRLQVVRELFPGEDGEETGV